MQIRSCFRKPGLCDSSSGMIGKHIGAEENRDGGSAVRILFCNIARMKYYKGIVPEVNEPKFGGAYVAQTGDAGEQYNSAPLKTDTGEFCFGMADTKSTSGGKSNQLHIERLEGVSRSADEADGVLVTLF